jgi:endonuclease YncB( thermonuclease family)
MRMVSCGCAAMAVLLMSGTLSFANDVNGTVGRISDGDTFHVCQDGLCTKIRVCGIDAPERRQVGWTASRDALQAIVEGKVVRCVPVGEGTVCDGRSKRKSWDRVVAQCFVGQLDVGGALVADGYACDWVRFSGGYYRDLTGGPSCAY